MEQYLLIYYDIIAADADSCHYAILFILIRSGTDRNVFVCKPQIIMNTIFKYVNSLSLIFHELIRMHIVESNHTFISLLEIPLVILMNRQL